MFQNITSLIYFLKKKWIVNFVITVGSRSELQFLQVSCSKIAIAVFVLLFREHYDDLTLKITDFGLARILDPNYNHKVKEPIFLMKYYLLSRVLEDVENNYKRLSTK